MSHRKTGTKRKLLLVNIFGGLGYLSCVLQWLWTAVLLLPPLLQNETIKEFILPEQSDQPAPTVSPMIDGSSLVVTIVAIIITVIVLAITVIVIARLPIALIKSSKKVVDEATRTIIPIATHHQKISPKKERELTVRVRFYMKLGIVILPYALLSFSYVVPTNLDKRIIFAAGSFFAIGSLLWFTLQYATAKFFRIKLATIV